MSGERKLLPTHPPQLPTAAAAPEARVHEASAQERSSQVDTQESQVAREGQHDMTTDDDVAMAVQELLHPAQAQPSLQSEGIVSPRLAEMLEGLEPYDEPPPIDTFMELLPGVGPTPQQMWAQLGADVMLEHSSKAARPPDLDESI